MSQPHARFPHLFVVVRVDDYLTSERTEDRISLVSAFSTEQDALDEAERLNALNADKGGHYTVLITRLKD